jgi:hypothetical protein
MTWRHRALPVLWQERREREKRDRSSHSRLMLKHPRIAPREGKTELQHNIFHGYHGNSRSMTFFFAPYVLQEYSIE